MKLSRINAISGDIVCTQQRDMRVVKKKKKKWPVPMVWGVGAGGLEDVKDQRLFPDASESEPVCCSSRKLLTIGCGEGGLFRHPNDAS